MKKELLSADKIKVGMRLRLNDGGAMSVIKDDFAKRQITVMDNFCTEHIIEYGLIGATVRRIITFK